MRFIAAGFMAFAVILAMAAAVVAVPAFVYAPLFVLPLLGFKTNQHWVQWVAVGWGSVAGAFVLGVVALRPWAEP